MDGPNKDENWTWPNKGNVEEAKHGVDKLIKRAAECLNKPSILESPASSTTDASKATQNTRHEQATIISIEAHQKMFSNEEKASSYLQDEMWVHQVIQALDPEDVISNSNHSNGIPQTSLDRADLLQKQLEQRLGRHCQVRIQNEKKRDHWSMMWAGKCLPQLSAIMVLFGHVKNDLACLDLNACLLADPSVFKKATTPTGKILEGCYLYYDQNDHKWIRSGKAVGSNFALRHEQHLKESKWKSSNSQKSEFYSSYPSRSVILADNRARKGNFENLQQYIGVGYNKLLKKNMLKDVKDKGIFHLDDEINKRIDALNFKGKSRLNTKQCNMIGYLLELGYDLCLAPDFNISGNPGFEIVLGINK